MSQNWQPRATISALKKRGGIIKKIRAFFAELNVLEVETPLLSKAAVTDPHLQSIPAFYQQTKKSPEQKLYLQTSPEFAMKRLLAYGSSDIYQICKAFRNSEEGRLHSPEFTILEWYRVGFNHHKLMDEAAKLLKHILPAKNFNRFSYEELFTKYLALNPHAATIKQLKTCAVKHNLPQVCGIDDKEDKDIWLQILMSECIEPKLKDKEIVFIYDYPESQAALSNIRLGNPNVAERFEIYAHGIELANGFHELTNAKEQSFRFKRDLQNRELMGEEIVPIDHDFLAALQHGLPECAGVALGVDRLVMLALNECSLEKVMV